MPCLIEIFTKNVLDYFYPRTKYELDRMNRFRDMAIQNYTRRLTAAILDLVQPVVETFDLPTPKTLQ